MKHLKKYRITLILKQIPYNTSFFNQTAVQISHSYIFLLRDVYLDMLYICIFMYLIKLRIKYHNSLLICC